MCYDDILLEFFSLYAIKFFVVESKQTSRVDNIIPENSKYKIWETNNLKISYLRMSITICKRPYYPADLS